jgi:predicted nucleotidyltransferase
MPDKATDAVGANTGISLTQEEYRCVTSLLQAIVPEREVRAFGSRTTSVHKPFSDLDLVVMGDHALPADKAADLRQSFTDSDLTFKVDVVVWSELQDAFKRIIESKSVVIQSAPHP